MFIFLYCSYPLIIPSNFPITVTGYIYPYPTVSNVDAAHHMPEKTFLKVSGCALCSMLYIQRLALVISTRIINTDEMSCCLLLLRTSLITLKES